MLDTDISSYIMRRSHAVLLDRLQQVPISEVCISVMTKAELMYGAEISPRPKQDRTAVEAYLRHVVVLDYPDGAALHYGQIRAFLKGAGKMIGANDLLIAAHARALDLTVVTNNTRDFGKVPDLKVENWTEPAA